MAASCCYAYGWCTIIIDAAPARGWHAARPFRQRAMIISRPLSPPPRLTVEAQPRLPRAHPLAQVALKELPPVRPRLRDIQDASLLHVPVEVEHDQLQPIEACGSGAEEEIDEGTAPRVSWDAPFGRGKKGGAGAARRRGSALRASVSASRVSLLGVPVPTHTTLDCGVGGKEEVTARMLVSAECISRIHDIQSALQCDLSQPAPDNRLSRQNTRLELGRLLLLLHVLAEQLSHFASPVDRR